MHMDSPSSRLLQPASPLHVTSSGPESGSAGDDSEPSEPSDSDGREWSIIQTLLAEAPASDDLDIGPGDDAAVWKSGQCWTCDTLVEGVHWDERLAPEDVGFKAVAASVSDLIAMGARPRWALLSLTLPDPVDERFVARFAAGFGEASRRWDVALAGGDTTRGHERIVVTVTMGGWGPGW